jgi:hypothetical protein
VFISQLLYTIIPAIPGQTKNSHLPYTVKKKIPPNKEIQKGSVAKSYMRKGFLGTVWGNTQIYLVIYDEGAVLYDFPDAFLISFYMRKISFFLSV